jgi:hypothetical protein
MKKILTILFLLTSTISFAQMGIVNYDTIQSKAIQADSALWIRYLENGGTDTLLTHIDGKIAYVLPSQFLLTQFDSTGFRVTIPQVVNLLDSLNQLNNMINEGFTNAHEADPLFQDWNRTDGINIYRKQVIDLDIQYFEKELSNSENNINVGFTIDNNCLVVFNGQTLPKTAWEGNGTSLSLNLDVRMYDNLIIKKQ